MDRGPFEDRFYKQNQTNIQLVEKMRHLFVIAKDSKGQILKLDVEPLIF